MHTQGLVPRLVESQFAFALRQQHSDASEWNFRVLAANTNNVSKIRAEANILAGEGIPSCMEFNILEQCCECFRRLDGALAVE